VVEGDDHLLPLLDRHDVIAAHHQVDDALAQLALCQFLVELHALAVSLEDSQGLLELLLLELRTQTGKDGIKGIEVILLDHPLPDLSEFVVEVLLPDFPSEFFAFVGGCGILLPLVGISLLK
jgi:hypothetical protein